MERFRSIVEYLAGERDLEQVQDAPKFLTGQNEWIIRCAVWAVAVLLIYAFSGQTSKFIYIDF
jgi:hypothetical protein